jgi:hypothetical protein
LGTTKTTLQESNVAIQNPRWRWKFKWKNNEHQLVGGAIMEKYEFVNGKDDITCIMEKMFETTNQPTFENVLRFFFQNCSWQRWTPCF